MYALGHTDPLVSRVAVEKMMPRGTRHVCCLRKGVSDSTTSPSAIYRENLTNALVAAQQRHDQGNTHTQDGEEIEGVLEEQAWGLRVR